MSNSSSVANTSDASKSQEGTSDDAEVEFLAESVKDLSLAKGLFPKPIPAIDAIAKDMYEKMIPAIKSFHIKSINRLRSPFMEFLFLNQLELFKQFGKGTITLAYHGTSSANLNSISDLGFLDPNSPKYHVANGNAYGKGIYATTDVNYARGYARTAFIVVAVLEGDSTTDCTGDTLQTHSRRTPVRGMIVLQSKTQVLPLFVLDLDSSFRSLNLSKIPFEKIPLFDFTKHLSQHMDQAKAVAEKFNVSVGLALHVCYRAATMYPDDINASNEWINDYLDTFNLQDIELPDQVDYAPVTN